MPIKLDYALEVKIWEMFDFGHVVRRKELKEAIQTFAGTADDLDLRLALKIIRALNR